MEEDESYFKVGNCPYCNEGIMVSVIEPYNSEPKGVISVTHFCEDTEIEIDYREEGMDVSKVKKIFSKY
jgi:hypothetical protein